MFGLLGTAEKDRGSYGTFEVTRVARSVYAKKGWRGRVRGIHTAT